jgi:D-glycerate 3-kinase
MMMSITQSNRIAELLQQQQLPAEFITTIEEFFWPLAQAIAAAHTTSNKSLIIGINGSQGSGKSTLADILNALLSSMPSISSAAKPLSCAVLSIDDLYLTKAQRQHLATTVHPLFATRGVPGTHDIELGLRTINALQNANETSITPLPRFNKAIDDRFDETTWPQFIGRADIIILEGWCVGAKPQTAAQLIEPINALEANEDSDGIWRRYANEALSNDYQNLFNQLDWQIMLAAPSFDCVYQWRKQQEQQLAERIAKNGADNSGVMNDAALKRFIQHYERITRQLLADMPARADWLFTLADTHQIIAARTLS